MSTHHESINDFAASAWSGGWSRFKAGRRVCVLRHVLLSALFVLPMLPGVSLEAAAQTLALEEIVVTARKRDENLQDVPLAITAFSSEELRNRGVSNLFEAVDFVPNLVLEPRAIGNDERPVIRGMQGPEFFGLSPAVSYFVDGVALVAPFGNLPLGNVERVEIIRGPQSALFGRSTFSGAINYITKRPSDMLEGDIALDGGSDGKFEVQGNLSGPIIENRMSFRLGAQYKTFDGEERWTNVYSGERYGSKENMALSGALFLNASENLEVDLRVTYSDDDNGPGAYGQFAPDYRRDFVGLNPDLPGADPAGWVNGELNADDLAINVRDDGYADYGGPGFDQETWLTSLRLSYDLGGYEIISVTGYNDLFWEQRDNQSRTPVSVFDFFGGPTAPQAVDQYGTESIDQEIKIASPQQGAFRWLLGGTYRRDERTANRLQGALQTNFPTFDQVRNWGVFGSASYDFMERYTLNIEWRYQEDRVREEDQGATPEAFSEKFTAFLPRVILEYAPRDDLMLYLMFAEGYRPGRTREATNEDFRLEPELNNTYELGLKSLWMDSRLLVNAAFFYVDWQDLWSRYSFFEDPNDVSTLTSVLTNVGDASVVGTEIEISYVISEGWTAGLSYGLSDVEFQDGFQTREATDLFGVVAGLEFVEGNQSRYSPKQSMTLNSTWRQALTANWEYFVRADYNYQAKRFATELNTAYYGPSHRANIRAGVESENISITAYANNLFDDSTLAGSGRFVNLHPVTRISPRVQPTQNFIAEGHFTRGRHYGVAVRYAF